MDIISVYLILAMLFNCEIEPENCGILRKKMGNVFGYLLYLDVFKISYGYYMLEMTVINSTLSLFRDVIKISF